MADKKAVKEKISAARKQVKEQVKKKVAQHKPASPNTVKQNRLKLLITIVARSKAEYYADLLQSFEVNLQTILLAEGTANVKTLELLGLANTEKAVILSVIQESKIPDALATLEEKFNTIREGKGVACTIPLTSVIGTLIYGFLSNNTLTVKEGK